MILKKKVENFHKNWQIFDESALFKGMKSHDAGPGKPRLWYQNDRQNLSYKSSIKKALGGLRAKPGGQFTEKKDETN